MPSKSKKQQRFMGMVHACKKNDYKDCASKEVEDTARGMKAKDAKEFASTKHKGLPEKKKETSEMKINTNKLLRLVKEVFDDYHDFEPAYDVMQGEKPIPPEELHGALSAAIWDLYKYANGVRPRFLDFDKMSVQDLEGMHDRLTKELEEKAEEDEGWMKDAEDERRDQTQSDADAENARLDATAAEEEEMKTPEAGEEFPKRTGMRRRMNESATRRDTANKLYNLLIMEQEYGIITPQELTELRDAINKVLGVSVGNML